MYNELIMLKKQLSLAEIPQETIESYEKDFSLKFTHNSTAIEGNTLTIFETKAILEDGFIASGKSLREVYEVVNHEKAFSYVKKCISEGRELDESIVKDIHSKLMDNIIAGGIYRNVDVYISGSQHTPPTPNQMYVQVKEMYATLSDKQLFDNDIELAAWTHAEFVRIHPFVDGNGRTARLLMNYQLIKNGWLPISIEANNRAEYYEALEQYSVNGNLAPFSEMIMKLEKAELDKYLSVSVQKSYNTEETFDLTTDDEKTCGR